MDKIKKIISLLSLALYVSYYASTSFFFHTHTDESGREFTHSHPYTSGNHSHNASAIQFINNLSNLLFVGDGISSLLIPFAVSWILLYAFYKQGILNSIIGSASLRAPPVAA